jgi:biopolymer transport protein ExbD
MLHIIGGTLVTERGILFDLPDSSGLDEGEHASLVALVMPMPHETLVFFDDGRYTMGDETSAAAFCSHLEDRLSRLDRKTLLVLADRRVATGEIMKIAALARRSGVESVLFAEKRAGKVDE